MFCLLFFSIDSYGCPDAFEGNDKLTSQPTSVSLFDNVFPEMENPNPVQHSSRRRPTTRRRSAPKRNKSYEDLPSLFDTPPPPAETKTTKTIKTPREEALTFRNIDSQQNTTLSTARTVQKKTATPKLKNQKQIKVDVTNYFIEAFQARNFDQMKKLIADFSFLKSLRINTSSFFLKNYIEDLTVLVRFPEGISPAHIAVYSHDLEMLDNCLKMGLETRTIKRKYKREY